ncbi:diguanylate cyclase [Acidobacteria bacterium AH-259-O06]|nr:diguanylate cyclase [Acidobacteria bacterium AH-259-O06]
MKDVLIEKRKHVLWLQWLLVVAIAYLLYFGGLAETSSPLAILTLIILNAGLNIGLFFLPTKYFHRSIFDSILVVLNILMIALAIYLTGQATSDFYLFFFIILMMAAAGQNLKSFVLVVLITSGLYLLMVYRTGDFSFTSGFLLRIPFLFIVGLFFGYLVYAHRLRQERLEAESEFTADLFEFGKALAQAKDLPLLYSKIPKLINDIMMTDACELAIIEEGRMTYRRFENPPPQEAPVLDISKSIHETTYQSEEILISTALHQDPQFTEKEDFHLYPYQYYMGKSWKPAGGRAGLIAVYRHERGEWNAHDIKKFQFLTDQTVLGLQYVQVLKELEMQARTDGLTGLANYRYFFERIEEEFSQALSKKSLLSVMLMDIDHFKSINDTNGHDIGDEILRCLATALKTTTRHMDLPARRGGDEFIVLLPETDTEEVRGLSRKLIEQINSLDSDEVPSFSISLGCSTFPHDGTTISELLERADEALYFAKAQGRGCTWHYSEIPAKP